MKKMIQCLVLLTTLVGFGMMLPGCPPNAYNTLTISVTPMRTGEIRVDPDLSEYPPRAEVTLEAIPAEGWRFSNWIGTGFNTTTATTKLVMDGNKVVTAVFFPRFGGDDEPPASSVQDGGFEEGPNSVAWTQNSTLYDKIICDEIQCGSIGGIDARNGTYWAYFGTLNGSAETAQLEQTIVTPTRGVAILRFYLAVPAAEVGFQFQVSLIPDASPSDPVVLYEITEADALAFSNYQLVEVDASAYADGGTYTLRFDFVNDAGDSTSRVAVFVDDVSVAAG